MQYNHFPEPASHKYYFTDYTFLIYSKLQGETLIDTHDTSIKYKTIYKEGPFSKTSVWTFSVFFCKIFKVLDVHYILPNAYIRLRNVDRSK